jgi:hypothetical protein
MNIFYFRRHSGIEENSPKTTQEAILLFYFKKTAAYEKENNIDYRIVWPYWKRGG